MVGIAGVVGDGRLPESVAAWTRWRDGERSFAFSDDDLDLTMRAHPVLVDEQPATAEDGDVLLWVWGEVFGRGDGDDYEPRRGDPDGSARYCADCYDRRGLDFAADLNGHFAAVVYDRAERTVSFVTDRFATHPIYRADADGALAFASNPQALATHPDVSAEFDEEYLHEYLALRRVFGRETALSEMRELPPASVVTVDLDDGSRTQSTYWRPSYEPVDRPFSYFVDRLASILRDLFVEWTDDDLSYGTLLSGGGDSRLVQACIDQSVVAFHNADWMSREARIARRVAEISGDEFHLLERYDDHEQRTLETAPRLSSFSGWFDQAYFTEFESTILDRVDVLVSGLFADMLFDGGPLSTGTLSLGTVGTVELPVHTPIQSVDDYVEAKVSDVDSVPYFESDRSLREVLRENIRREDDGSVVSHGVRYESLTDLVMYGDYYPLGADTEAIFPRSLYQTCPCRIPFLDNRIVDLHRRMPTEYFLRRNVINAALRKVSPALAEVPHARTGVSLKRSFPVEFVGTNLTGFYRKHVSDEAPPAPHLDHKPWPNRSELLRVDPFAIETIRSKEEAIRELPFLDFDAAEDTYRAHLDGEDHHPTLYSLLTVLEMPLTALIAGDGDSGGRATDAHEEAVPSTVAGDPSERES